MRAAALLVAILAATTAAQQPATQHRLLVANKAESTLSIFDPATRKELATLPTGDGPHEVATAPDGALAVVSDYGAQKPGSTLTVVDPFAAKVLRTIPLEAEEVDPDGTKAKKTFLRPHGVQFVATDKVVVTSEAARRLLLVDLAKGRIERTWTTPQGTMHMVALDKTRTRAAATSIRDGNVVFFGLDADSTAATPPVACGDQSEGLAIDPATGAVWVGNRAANTLTVLDAAGKVTHTLETAEFPFRVAFTPDGSHALVSCANAGVVQIFDAKANKLVREVSIGGDRSEESALPMGLVTDDAGARAYVTCGRGEFVAVLDLAKGEVVDRLPARKGCDGIAWARRAAPAVPQLTR
jgi:YVTN family beta-propeller protein